MWAAGELPARYRAETEAYAAGVNAKIAELPEQGLPAMFAALGYQPAPWEPVDCLVVAKYMAWDQAGERFWVDADGRLMQMRQESAGRLVILSQEPEKRQIGDRVPPEVLASALLLRQERPNIESLYYDLDNGLSYQDGRHWRAYFGVSLDVAQKLAVYEALVADLQSRGLQPRYVSVINKDKPYYSLAEPAE